MPKSFDDDAEEIVVVEVRWRFRSAVVFVLEVTEPSL